MANVVASAVAERDGDADRTAGSLQGESLLLPLLQELLDKKGSQQHQQQQGLMHRSASSQSSEESATATVDSGTESGEDLRLLAVGLCDTMDSSRSAGVEPLGPGLLAEVQNALSRLAVSLQLESADVQMEPGKRQSLLQLVARLQANLVVPTKPPTERRPSGSHGRFAKHKNRQNRHTVGVSSEELAAARKLMEEVVLRDSLSSSVTPEYVPTPPDYTLQKQNSDGCVSSSSNQSQYRSVNFSPQATTPVKNATAKPFTFVGRSTPDTNYNSQQPSQPSVGFNKSVSEPSTPHDHNQSNQVVYREKNHGRQSLNLENVPNPYMTASESVRPVSECFTMDHNTPNINTWSSLESVPTQKANIPRHNLYSKQPEFPKEIQESETDDDSSTVKQSEDTDDNRQSVGPTPTQLHYVTDVKTVTRTITPVQDSMNNVSNSSISSRNSDYDLAREKEDLFNGKDLSSAQRLLNIAINDDSKTGNRFNTKKLKMKRANTIDIPKPLNFYVDDDDSDDSILDRDDQASTRRSNYLALRGPIRVGQGIKSNVPSFEPKTENDKKFMAFIQKHNNNNTNVTSLWCNKNAEPKKSAVVDQNWNRKFGNIKTVFEKEEDKSRPSSTTVSSAKQFWQSADDAVNAGRRSYSGPKVSKQGTRQLQSLFEQKQQEAKLPWTQTEHNNVVTGTLKVESNFKPIQNSQLIQGKNYKFVPQPLPVNKFSHAPMSAFKPPPKRTPVPNSVPIKQSCIYPTNTGVIKQPVSKDDNVKKPDPETPLFLYTPKQLEFLQSAEPQEETKPTSRAPWASGPGQQSEHRVLSLAASKFENPTSREVSPQPHRKPSKDKVYIPPILLNNTVDTYNQPLKQPYQPEHIPSKDLSSPYLVKNVQPTKHQVRKISGEYDHIPQTKIDINSGFRTPNQQIYKSSSDESNNSYVGKNDNIDPRDPVVQTVKQTVKKFSEDNKNDAKVIHKQYTEPGRRGNEEHMKVQMVNKADNSYKQPSRRMSAEYEHPIVADVHVVQQQSYQNPPQDYQQISQKYQSPPQNYQKVAQNYQSPPEDYQKIAQTYQSQSNDYQNAPQYYQAQYQTPDYQKLPQNYQDQNLQQTYQSQTASQKLNSTSMKPGTFEYPSSESSQSTAVTPDNLDELDINPFTEYKAVSKVMTGPVSQQAVTVTQKTPKRREDHDNAARNLQNVLKNISRSEDREEGPSRRSSRPSLSPNPSISYKNKSQSVTPTIESNQTSYQAQSQSQYANENNLKPEIPGRKMSCEERDISPNYASQTHYEQKPNYASQVQYSNKQYEPETAPSAFVPVNESTKVNIPNYGSQVQYSNKQYEQQTTPSTFKSVVKDTTYSSENTKMNTPSYASQYSNKQYEQRDTSAFKPVNEKSYQTENTKVATNKSNISNKQYEMESSKQKLEKVSGSRYHEKDTSQSVPSIQVNAKPFSMESLEINDDGESVVTTKLQIPVHSRIVQYNNTTNVQRTKEQVDTSNKLTTQSQPLSKSDSWQKLTTEKQQITAKPSPRASPRASPKARNILQKAKSSHSLAMPKQFEAGISRDEVEHKKKTVAAYFGASQPLSKTSSSSNIHSREERTKTQQSSINRTKTGHKMSTQSRSSGLSRSRTMSDVADMSENAVDIDEEFENIFRASIAK